MDVFFLFQQLAGSLKWQTMDPIVRGYYTQIILMAAQQKPIGYVPNSDKILRKWLSIPLPTKRNSKNSNTNIIKELLVLHPTITPTMICALQYLHENDIELSDDIQVGIHDWNEYLWNEHWKPQLFAALQIIDDPFIAQHPSFKNKTGFAVPILVQSLMNISLNPSSALGLNSSSLLNNFSDKTTKKRAPKTPISALLEGTPVFRLGDISLIGCAFLNYDAPMTRDIVAVQRFWTQAIPNEKRSDIWKFGVSILASDFSEEKQARSFLARMMTQHGEANVARAVAEISTRTVPPVERYSYFTNLLKTYVFGSKAEQKAREQRASVAL